MAWETWLTVSDGVAWVWRQEKRQIQDEMILVAYTVCTVCCLETRKFDLKWGWQIRVSNLARSISTHTQQSITTIKMILTTILTMMMIVKVHWGFLYFNSSARHVAPVLLCCWSVALGTSLQFRIFTLLFFLSFFLFVFFYFFHFFYIFVFLHVCIVFLYTFLRIPRWNASKVWPGNISAINVFVFFLLPYLSSLLFCSAAGV